jgi:hypothetical protein
MALIASIGDSERHPLNGGETWTVTFVIPGAELGLKEGDRLRFEEGPSPHSSFLYPDVSTGLYEQPSNRKLPMKLTSFNEIKGHTYYFQVKLGNGKPKDLWWQEGSTEPGSEAGIYEANPANGGGQNGGSAGIRR